MKSFHLIPLLFLSACSTSPKVALRPQPSPTVENASVRYPEVVRAYHFGRYVDPGDDLVMHEQHTVYRVEENTRWSLRTATDLPPATMGTNAFGTPVLRDAAFSPTPVNDDILAEVNSQRLATTQILTQSRAFSAMLSQFAFALHQTQTNWQQTAAMRATVGDLKQRLDAIESARESMPLPPANNPSTTNTAADPLSP